jgi:hypothetical protein
MPSAAFTRDVAAQVNAMDVTPANVLQIRNALQAESDRLSARLNSTNPPACRRSRTRGTGRAAPGAGLPEDRHPP